MIAAYDAVSPMSGGLEKQKQLLESRLGAVLRFKREEEDDSEISMRSRLPHGGASDKKPQV